MFVGVQVDIEGEGWMVRVVDKCYYCIYERDNLLRAQERPATLILTVISGFRITRACHVYNRDAETGN